MRSYVILVFACALPLGAQRLELRAVPPTLAARDSALVTATAFAVDGRRSPTSTVTWVTRPQGPVTIVPDAAVRGQQATIIGEVPGTTYVVASWRRSDGITLRDSARMQITSVRVTKMLVGLKFSRTVTGAWEQVAPAMTVGEQGRCLYAVALDKRGQVITGRAVTFQSSDPSVATFAAGGACPDTTIDPGKLP